MKKADKHTYFCSGCCKDKHEKECSWVEKPNHRYIRCNDCIEIESKEESIQFFPCFIEKEKVHFKCRECGSKKTINKKDDYSEVELTCKKCGTVDGYQIVK